MKMISLTDSISRDAYEGTWCDFNYRIPELKHAIMKLFRSIDAKAAVPIFRYAVFCNETSLWIRTLVRPELVLRGPCSPVIFWHQVLLSLIAPRFLEFLDSHCPSSDNSTKKGLKLHAQHYLFEFYSLHRNQAPNSQQCHRFVTGNNCLISINFTPKLANRP